MLDYQTAGESHGKCLVTVITGLPYGVPVDLDYVNRELKRRQGGYGRGARMKMEQDLAEVIGGLRHGKCLGSPIALQINNRVQNSEQLRPIERPRPGHADLPGAMKYGEKDARNVSERSSARNTAPRVAAGALANSFLQLFDIHVLGYLTEMGGVSSDLRIAEPAELRKVRDSSAFYSLDPELDPKLKNRVDEVRKEGDTIGGIFEVTAFGLPPGLGTHARWMEKLDGRLARAIVSVQTVKGFEVGKGFGAARVKGSQMHDEIVKRDGDLARTRNNAGGIEGGMTNGQPLVIRAACKPISTLRKPLRTVDLRTREEIQAQYERSDTCVVPAASVVGEAVISFELASAFLEKFGGDTYEETRDRYDRYRAMLRERFSDP